MAQRSTRRVVTAAAAVLAAAGLVLALRACAFDERGQPPDPAQTVDRTPVGGGGATPSRLAPGRTRGERTARSPQRQVTPSTEAGCQVRVRVTAADGTPVAGAMVALDDADDMWPETTSDSSGSASFQGVAAGVGSAIVRAAGFMEAVRRFEARPGATTDVDVELEPGAVVLVTVLDAVTEAPIGGAQVKLESVLGLADDFTQTDAAGRAVGLVSPGTPMIVGVEAEGHRAAAGSVRSGELGGEPAALVVRLVPAATLAGVVRTPDGGPIDGATVWIRREGSLGAGVEVESGDGGAYAVDGLLLGRAYLATAFADGWSASEDVRVTPRPEDRAMRFDLLLRPPSVVVVHTVDDDGEPLGGVSIDVDHLGGHHGGSGVAAVRRVDVEPGPCVVRAAAMGRVSARVERDVGPGETWEMTLTLSLGAGIGGRVVDSDGAPVPDAWVTVRRAQGRVADLDESADDDEDDDEAEISGKTDEDGRFDLRALAPGRHDLLVEAGPDFEDFLIPAVTAPSDGLHLVLSRHGRLRMRVEFDEAGALDEAGGMVEICGTDLDGRRIVVQHTIGEDGAVDVPWPRAAGEVTVSAPGTGAITRTVWVPRGGVADLGVVRLADGVEITGILTYPLGHAAASVHLRAHQDGAPGRIVSTTTADDGSFCLPGLSGGRAVIQAEPNDWPHASFDVEVGSGRVFDLELPRVGFVWLRVVAPDGLPEAGLPVSALGGDGRVLSWARSETDEQGTATLRLAPGPVTIHVDVDGGGRVQVEVIVRPDDLTVAEVRLP